MITIAKRGIMAAAKTCPPTTFQGATLDRRGSGEGGRTYRALLQSSDQNDAVPVTPCSTGGPGPARTVNPVSTWLGPVIQAGDQKWSQTAKLSGPNTQAAIAALRVRTRSRFIART